MQAAAGVERGGEDGDSEGDNSNGNGNGKINGEGIDVIGGKLNVNKEQNNKQYFYVY